jgi:hypothetical protein
LAKQQEAEPTEEQGKQETEKRFMNISLFDAKMIMIASSAMVFSIICGKCNLVRSNKVLVALSNADA